MAAPTRASRTATALLLGGVLALNAPAAGGDRQGSAGGNAPHFALAYWEPMPGPMQLPVFDGMAIELGQNLIVLGGFTRDLEATRAIQIRSPIDGWRPIGSTLGEPRARATLLPIGNRRVLVLGGYSGTWGRNAVARDDGETLDPLVAGSGRDIEPFGESLDGHTATPLEDGRIAVACGCSLRLFDPRDESWSAPMELARERHHHAAVRVGKTLLLIGGDEQGTIESVPLDALRPGEPASELWDAELGSAVAYTSAVALDGQFAFVAGGFRPHQRDTIASTWTIDVARRSVRKSTSLPLPNGACDLALARHPRGVIVLDGEWRDDERRGNVNAALLVSRLLDAEGRPHGVRETGTVERLAAGMPEVWRLPSLGPSKDLAHRMLVHRADGSIEAVGGYRYRAPTVDGHDAEAGVTVDGRGQRLVVDAHGTAD